MDSTTNKKGFVGIIAIIVAVIFVGVVSYVAVSKKSSSTNPSPRPTLPDSQTTKSVPDLASSDTCERLTGYSVNDYKAGWRKTFMKENKLTESQFNIYIIVTNVSLRPLGSTCDLTVRYTVKKDWLSVDRADSMTLGVPPTILPDDLPIESDTVTLGRVGVSAINLLDTFSFGSKNEALNYFLNTYDLAGTNARIQKEDFQYFWDKENAKRLDYSSVGEGGEAYVTVVGTIDSSQNKCYRGDVFLVSKKTTYSDVPCIVN